jgi:uncharacterized protein (DUF433 family)
LTNNGYVEFCEGGYYVRDTRVSLASVVHAFREGASADGILMDFPAIRELSKVYGAVAFILENPQLIQNYLADQERLWDEFEGRNPFKFRCATDCGVRF